MLLVEMKKCCPLFQFYKSLAPDRQHTLKGIQDEAACVQDTWASRQLRCISREEFWWPQIFCTSHVEQSTKIINQRYLVLGIGSHLLPRCRLPWWLSGKRIFLPVWEMWVQSLDWEDPLEKEIATHSSILAWGIPSTDEWIKKMRNCFSHKKERRNAVCNSMDEPRDHHTKWSKPEKGKFHITSRICGT